MNAKERQALLKILLIKEELNAHEFNNVLDFIKNEIVNSGDWSDKIKKTYPQQKRNRSSLLELINDLKKDEPEKYEILHNLYKAHRSGLIFQGVADVRSFAERSKLFDVDGKNKSEIIYKLFEKLSSLRYEQLENATLNVAKISSKDDDAYKNLSNFIMSPDKEK
ncbi:hypothetical protein [Aeromonas veronii]|uniref:hypothetical protein n=1 Tax=Aeromonas veronii TaxID=654 RepID=UPI001F45210C|nr:hypothetical protein [Aeromonas veronii]MCF5840954.1 hypothetical protein [Aeromonas veronii]WOE84674.1 hypothetical protein RY930_22120 [Aeromonas veronii]